jgi:uncharacterized membrane protein
MGRWFATGMTWFDGNGFKSGGWIMSGFAHQWLVEPWGYGGYGPIHMIIWIILVIAFMGGVMWRVVRAQREPRR